MHYRLLAADMDGTLLNSQKTISPPDAEALNRAMARGKVVVFSTGRCIAELREFFPLFPKMRYVLGESGALVYDLREKRAIFRKSFDTGLVQSVCERLEGRDLMPQILISDAPVMNRRDVASLARFQMTHYQRHFDKTGKLVEDVWAECAAQCWQADKICLYHTSAQERALTRKALEDLPIAFADAEETSLELSPLGVDKGKGLGILCRHLGIPMEQTIAVGDSYNDLSVLRAAGLAVAVGNAVRAVRTSCAAVVADNDHCGVAEAVERFLLR